ncbi:MAG: hypothetical protein DRO40_12175 [Thermoprotei archaeon]|nr:MAG: hypothetical protein DRO40_12175 [Thermoprotei archaeon]
MRIKRHGNIIELDLDDDVAVVSVKMKKSMINKIDELTRKYAFSSRSDFIRTALTWFIKYLNGGVIEEELKKELLKRSIRNNYVYESF